MPAPMDAGARVFFLRNRFLGYFQIPMTSAADTLRKGHVVLLKPRFYALREFCRQTHLNGNEFASLFTVIEGVLVFGDNAATVLM